MEQIQMLQDFIHDVCKSGEIIARKIEGLTN